MVRTLLVLVLLAGTARADEVDQAVEELRLDDAVVLLSRAWTEGSNDAVRAGAIALRAGDLSATIGDRAAASRWFALAVAIDPSAELPAGTSPKVSELLGRAREALADRRFGAQVAGRSVRVEDPLGVIVTVRGDRRSAEVENGRAALGVRDGETVELLDGYDNVLWSGVMRVPRAVALAAPPPERSWIARWPAWAVGAGALATGAGAMAYLSLDARSDLDALHRDSGEHEASEALAVERRMQRTAIVAQVAGVAALAAGVTALVLWRSEQGDETERRVVPLATDGGGGIALEGRF